MSELPAPLSPPGCDMSGNDWFPLYFRRLRSSRWWRRASDIARARNVMLWGEAYQSVPAGSLPDDDDDLAEAAGFGFDVDGFLAHKTEIMAPWVLCSDGRWYHPTVCEAASEAWSKLGEKRRAARERKAAERDRIRSARIVTPPLANVTRDIEEDRRDIATHTGHTGQEIQDANASLSPSDGDEKPKAYPSAFEDCWKAYPHSKGRSSKPKSLGVWRRIPASTRQQLPSAIARYARDGREPHAECGAPAMQRWLSEERWLDWLSEADAAPATPERWSARVEMFAENAKWSEPWGPKPGEPHCRAPPNVLAEFGFHVTEVAA